MIVSPFLCFLAVTLMYLTPLMAQGTGEKNTQRLYFNYADPTYDTESNIVSDFSDSRDSSLLFSGKRRKSTFHHKLKPVKVISSPAMKKNRRRKIIKLKTRLPYAIYGLLNGKKKLENDALKVNKTNEVTEAKRKYGNRINTYGIRFENIHDNKIPETNNFFLNDPNVSINADRNEEGEEKYHDSNQWKRERNGGAYHKDINIGNFSHIYDTSSRDSSISLDSETSGHLDRYLEAGSKLSREVGLGIREHSSEAMSSPDTPKIKSVPDGSPANDFILRNSITSTSKNNTRLALQQDNRSSLQKSREIIRLADRKITSSKSSRNSGFVRVYKVNGTHILNSRKIKPSRRMRQKVFGRNKKIKPLPLALSRSNLSMSFPWKLSSDENPMNFLESKQNSSRENITGTKVDRLQLTDATQANISEEFSVDLSFYDDEESDENLMPPLSNYETGSESNKEDLSPAGQINTLQAGREGNAKFIPLTEFRETKIMKDVNVQVNAANEPEYDETDAYNDDDEMAVFVESKQELTYALPPPLQPDNTILRQHESESWINSSNLSWKDDIAPNEFFKFPSPSELYRPDPSSPFVVTRPANHLTPSQGALLLPGTSYRYPILLSTKYPTTKSQVLVSHRYPSMSAKSANLLDYNPVSVQHKAYYIEPHAPSSRPLETDSRIFPISVVPSHTHSDTEWLQMKHGTDGAFAFPNWYLSDRSLEPPPIFPLIFKNSYSKYHTPENESTHGLHEYTNPGRFISAEFLRDFGNANFASAQRIKSSPTEASFKDVSDAPSFESAANAPSSNTPLLPFSLSTSSDQHISPSQRESKTHKETNAINRERKFSRSGRLPQEISNKSLEAATAKKNISQDQEIPVPPNHLDSFARYSHQDSEEAPVEKTTRNFLQKDRAKFPSTEKQRDRVLVSLPRSN